MSDKNLNQEEENIFVTRDIYLASVLVTLNFFMLGFDLQIEGTANRPIGYFKFENSKDLQKTRQLYTQGMLVVEPKMYISNMKSLKAEIENARKRPMY